MRISNLKSGHDCPPPPANRKPRGAAALRRRGRSLGCAAASLVAVCFHGASAIEPVSISGPWGTLEYHKVALEPPETQLWDGLFVEETLWDFPLPDREAVLALLASLGFPEPLCDAMRTRGVWGEGLTESQTRVELDDELVRMIGSEQRKAVTHWWQENYRDFLARLIVNIEPGNLDQIERRVGRAAREVTEWSAFRRGEVTATIDRAYILRQLATRAEKEAFIRSIFTSQTLVVRLVLDESSDLDEVIRYWSAGGKNSEVESILAGLYYAGGVEKIDIIHLMPPNAKKYLFAFTRYQDINPFNAPDCFWTAQQFFRPAMSQRVLDSLPLEYYLDADFETVAGEPQIGDLVCIFEPDTHDFVHAYVHIAGDVVFSKNGTSFIRPHILTTFDQMMSVYDEGDRYFFQVYRRRPGT